MELFSLEFFAALGMIIVIDLVLAGDNAIVIGMAARNVEKDKQKKVILWGTAGAIIIRIAATLLVVKLLNLPWLHLVGGLLLIWIAVKLLVEDSGHNIAAKSTMTAAIWTIIIADAAMGIDNVLAIAGAANGSMALVIIGLIISIPIMVWGSTLLIKWMERFPIIIYLGAGVIAWTAANMITSERFLAEAIFDEFVVLKWVVVVAVVIAVMATGKFINYVRKKKSIRFQADEVVL